MNYSPDVLTEYSRSFMIYMLYYWSRLVHFYSDIFERLVMKLPPLSVYKIMSVTEDGYDEERTDLYFKGKSLKTNEERIEYRVTWQGTKYRVINEVPRYDMFVRQEPQTYKNIIMAVLHNPVENVEENVTSRVTKFAGPNHNFYEQSNIKMKWLFESDDLLDETKLVLLLSNGLMLKFAPDDEIVLKSA